MPSNFNDLLPAAPAGGVNVKWATDGAGNDSAYIPSGSFLPSATVLPANTPAIGGDALTAYDSTTGLFSQASVGGGGGFSSLVGYRRTAYCMAQMGSPAIQVGEQTNPAGGYSDWQDAVPASKQAGSAYFRSNVTDTFAGWKGAVGYVTWWSGSNMHFFSSTYLAQTTTERMYVGLFQQTLGTAALFATDTDTTHSYACFRYSTVAGDTNIQCITCGGAAQTITDSGVPMDTKTHKYLVVCDDTTPNVKFYVDGNLVATHTTNLLVANTNLYYVSGVSSSDGTSVYIGNSQIAAQSDY